jgi:hypothetical protein
MGDLFFVGEYELGVAGDVGNEKYGISLSIVHSGEIFS